MMGWGDSGGSGFIGIVEMLMMVAFLVMVVVGTVLLIKALTGGGRQRTTHPSAPDDARAAVPPTTGFSPPAPRSDALRILEERYARGEIERDEFLQRKADLGS